MATFAYLMLSARGTPKIPGCVSTVKKSATTTNVVAATGLSQATYDAVITLPFSSVFSVVFLNNFHHDANSLLEGGETVDSGEGAGTIRGPD